MPETPVSQRIDHVAAVRKRGRRAMAAVLAIAAVGGRVLPTGRDVPWRRLDTIVGGLFLLAAAYYLARVLSGDVTTAVPGEPGSGVLP